MIDIEPQTKKVFFKQSQALMHELNESISPEELEPDDIADEPFNLEDTSEALHLFDIDFEVANEEILDDNDETEIEGVKSNDHEVDIKSIESLEDVWTKFTAMESWTRADEELVPAFDLSDFDLANIESNDHIPEDITPLDSGKMLAEMLKADFPTSDIDTAIEESPIYQDKSIDIQLDPKENDATIRVPLNHLEILGDLSEELLVRKGSLDIYLGEIKTLSGQAQSHLQLLERNPDSQNQIAIAELQNAVEQIVNALALAEQQTDAMSQDVNHLRKNLRQVLKHHVHSLMRVLLIDVNQMCLAISSKMVLEVIPCDFHAVDADEQDTLLWRDRILPIVRLNALLKMNCRHSHSQSGLQSNQSPQPTNSPKSQKPSHAVPSLLVIHYENDLFALQTDGCWHDQEATFHQIEGDIILPRIFLGTVILGSNRAVALLNPAELVSQCLYPHDHVLTSQEMPSNLDNLSSLSDFFSAGDAPDLAISAITDINATHDLVRSPKLENLESSGLFTSELVKSQNLRSQQPRVLIVESSANVRRYLAMSLTKSGFLTEQAQDGKEAIAFLKNCLKINLKIDVVITDLEMPHMDGFKLLSSVFVDDDLHNLPIIVLTAKNSENDRKLALDLGAKAYFCKPYREHELVEKLHQVISEYM